MLDFVKDLSQVFLSGYVALAVFTFRQNRGFSRLEGEKYLMSLLALGMFSHFLFLLAKAGYLGLGWPAGTLNAIQIGKFIFYVVAGALIGGVLSQNEVLETIKASSQLLRQKKIPHPSSLFEENLLDAIYVRPMPLLIETVAGKFYVAFVREADIADNIPYDERIIRIAPIRSGARDQNGRVTYHHEYLKDMLFEKAINDPDAHVEAFAEAVLDVPVVTIFMKDIRSYREFSPKLHSQFQALGALD